MITASEIDAIVHTANNPKQAIAVGFTLGYLRAQTGTPNMEVFACAEASAPELATEEGRSALTEVIDGWIAEHRPPAPETNDDVEPLTEVDA